VTRNRVVTKRRVIYRTRKRHVTRVVTRNRHVTKTVLVRGTEYWRSRAGAILRRLGDRRYQRCIDANTRARRSRTPCVRAGVQRLRAAFRNPQYVKCLAGVKAFASASLLEVSQGELPAAVSSSAGNADPNDNAAAQALVISSDPNGGADHDDDDDEDDELHEGGSDLLLSAAKGWRTRHVYRSRNRYVTVPKVINRQVIRFQNVYRTRHVPVVQTKYRTRVIRRTVRKQAAIANAEVENDLRHVRLCKVLGAGRATPRVIREIRTVKIVERKEHAAHLRALAAAMRARAAALRSRAGREASRRRAANLDARAERDEIRRRAEERNRRAEDRHRQSSAERDEMRAHIRRLSKPKTFVLNHHLETKHTQNVHVHLDSAPLNELRRDVRDATRGVLEDFYADLAKKRAARSNAGGGAGNGGP
jgi:hypothetical protein